MREERRRMDDNFGNRVDQGRPAWRDRSEARAPRQDGDRPQWRERRSFGEGRPDSREPRRFDRAPRPEGRDSRPSREGERRFDGPSDRPRRRFGRDDG